MSLQLKNLTDNVLIVQATGSFPTEDYEEFLRQIDEEVEQFGRTRIFVDMHDFLEVHDWHQRTVWKELACGRECFNAVKRLAIVGASTCESWMASFCQPFTKAEVRFYDTTEADAARVWIEEE